MAPSTTRVLLQIKWWRQGQIEVLTPACKASIIAALTMSPYKSSLRYLSGQRVFRFITPLEITFVLFISRFQMTKPHISIAVGGSLSPNLSSRAGYLRDNFE